MKVSDIRKSFKQSFDYGLFFTTEVFNPENLLLRDTVAAYRPDNQVKILVVVDSGVSNRHPALEQAIRKYMQHHREVLCCCEILEVPGGEASKNNSQQVEKVLSSIDQQGICRHSLVLAVGGGAVIDMAGYAASIAHRGIRIIRIPTTVLAQNDAAVGVKNGINAFGKKNFLGTFAVPLAIINDTEFLTTLQRRDWIAGIAEAIKVALIKDAPFFEFIAANVEGLMTRDSAIMQQLIYRCALLHMDHITSGGDPFETGSARPLDFGHWAAHKLEQMTNFDLRHGEAVAIGMAIDTVYSHKLGLLTEAETNRVLDLFEKLGFPMRWPLAINAKSLEELLHGLVEFQEHLGGILTITLLTGLGSRKEVHEIEKDKMLAAIQGVVVRYSE